jgi:hypothetical protein
MLIATHRAARAQIILKVNFRHCEIMTPSLLKCNFMQCAGLLVFSQLVNFQWAGKRQDKVCVNVQTRQYEMRKVEYREKVRGEKYW